MAGNKPKPKKEGKTFHLELTPLSLFIWGFCIFFLLSWVFVLGIMVGKGFLPGAITALSDIKGQITILQEMISRNKPRDLQAQREQDLEPKLAFYDRLSNKKEEAINQRVPSKKDEGLQKVNPKEGRGHAEKETTPSGTKNSELLRKESGSPGEPVQFTVQIASLEDKNKATEIVTRLTEKGYQAFFYEVQIKGKTFYRVRCMKFPNREQAEGFAHQLENKEGIKGFVTRAD